MRASTRRSRCGSSAFPPAATNCTSRRPRRSRWRNSARATSTPWPRASPPPAAAARAAAAPDPYLPSEGTGSLEAMTMTAQERTEFVNAYTRALITAWSSEDFSHRLAQDPKATLTDVGLNIPAGAQVELIRTIPAETGAEADIDAQVALWETALSTGRYELHIPETPQVGMAE